MVRTRFRVVSLLAVAALAVVTTACGDDDDTAAPAATTAASETSAAAATTTAASGATATTAASAATTATTTAAAQEGPGTPAPKPLAAATTIKAGVAGKSFEAYANMLLADHLGEFEKENLKVDIQVIPVPEMVALLTSGALDVAPLGANAGPLNAIASGSDLAIVAAMPTFQEASKQGIWVKSDLMPASGTFDPCEFKGKTIAFGSAALSNTVSLPLSRALATCDLTLKDISISTLTGPDVLVALENGSIDGGFLADPAWADPDTRGYAKLAVPFGTFSVNGYMMGKLRTEEPDVAAAFVRAMVRTSRTYLQGDYHKDPAVRQALLDITQGKPEVFDASLSLVFDPNLEYRNIAEAIEVQQVWIDAGDILSYDAPLPADEFVDESILDQVLAE